MRIRSVLAAGVVTALVAGCAPDPDPDPVVASSDGDDAADGERAEDGPATAEPVEPAVLVVATVAPVADLVTQVGGDRVEVRSLVPAGADSHTYEPRPSDVGALEEADLYVGVGLDLNDAALALAEANVGDDVPIVRLGEELDTEALVFDHSHDGDEGHSHSHDGEDGPGPNPHVWTSVRAAAAMVDRIADLLADVDPEGASDHRSRAAAYTTELEQLDGAIAEATATIPDDARTLVTFHDAWTYFARDYDLEFATAVQPADFTEPSASEVRDVIDLVRSLEVPAVFGSEVFPSRVLEAIAGETDAVYVGDLADDVLPGGPGDADHSYDGLMRRNATVIVEALGGDPSALR